MSRLSKSYHSWNEFQWEREIRRDEKRISCYFRELAGCLDLPGEDEMIFDRLLTRPGLVPANADPAHWRMWDDFDAGDEEDEEHESRGRNAGDELIAQLDKMACEWNAVLAFQLRESLKREGGAAICGFGKLMSRLSDFIETREEEMPGLKLSLSKRVLADVGELCRRLRQLGERQKSLRPKTASLIESLLQLRERVIDLAAELRSRGSSAQ